MEEIKYKITTQFKILESSESDSTKIVARSKDSEVQKHRSYNSWPTIRHYTRYEVWGSRDDDR